MIRRLPTEITAADAVAANTHLPAALERGGSVVTHTMEDVWRAILLGEAQLWVGERSAAVTQIDERPRARLLNVWLIGGDLDEVLAAVPAFEAFGREFGCVALVGVGRRGWTRKAPGWTEVATVVERVIPNG